MENRNENIVDDNVNGDDVSLCNLDNLYCYFEYMYKQYNGDCKDLGIFILYGIKNGIKYAKYILVPLTNVDDQYNTRVPNYELHSILDDGDAIRLCNIGYYVSDNKINIQTYSTDEFNVYINSNELSDILDIVNTYNKFCDNI